MEIPENIKWTSNEKRELLRKIDERNETKGLPEDIKWSHNDLEKLLSNP